MDRKAFARCAAATASLGALLSVGCGHGDVEPAGAVRVPTRAAPPQAVVVSPRTDFFDTEPQAIDPLTTAADETAATPHADETTVTPAAPYDPYDPWADSEPVAAISAGTEPSAEIAPPVADVWDRYAQSDVDSADISHEVEPSAPREAPVASEEVTPSELRFSLGDRPARTESQAVETFRVQLGEPDASAPTPTPAAKPAATSKSRYARDSKRELLPVVVTPRKSPGVKPVETIQPAEPTPTVAAAPLSPAAMPPAAKPQTAPVEPTPPQTASAEVAAPQAVAQQPFEESTLRVKLATPEPSTAQTPATSALASEDHESRPAAEDPSQVPTESVTTSVAAAAAPQPKLNPAPAEQVPTPAAVVVAPAPSPALAAAPQRVAPEPVATESSVPQPRAPEPAGPQPAPAPSALAAQPEAISSPVPPEPAPSTSPALPAPVARPAEIAAAPPSASMPLPQVATPRSPALVASLAQADERVRHAIQLAEKGAMYASRKEFTAALSLIAQAHDVERGTRRHSQAVSAGLLALKESNDFVLGNSAEINVVRLVAGHRTPVLKQYDVSDLPPTLAAQYYYAFAKEQLSAGIGRETVGSIALYGLAKLTLAGAGHNSQQQQFTGPAIALYQAALICEPQNFRAAHELGVLLAGSGQLELARELLLGSVNQSPQPIMLKNLAVVHARMGEPHLAAEAKQKADVLQQTQPESNVPQVQWVDPATFAGLSKSSDLPPQPPAATSGEESTPKASVARKRPDTWNPLNLRR